METPEKSNSPKTISSAKEFMKRRNVLAKGKVIELPESGLNIRCGRPSIEDLILNDAVPKNLINIAVKRQSGQVSEQDLKGVIKLRDFVVKSAVIQPKVVDKDPKEGEITIDCIPRADKDFIFNYVEKGDKIIDFFRKK